MKDCAVLAAFVDARLDEQGRRLAERSISGPVSRARCRIDRARLTHDRRILDAWRGDGHGKPAVEGRLCEVAARFADHPDFREDWMIEPW